MKEGGASAPPSFTLSEKCLFLDKFLAIHDDHTPIGSVDTLACEVVDGAILSLGSLHGVNASCALWYEIDACDVNNSSLSSLKGNL